MIKFFRHIRQKHILENKTGSSSEASAKAGRYFKYAIGEIILVVIGILVALQINNWNNDRINTNRESNYIKNIERDLNNQLKAIDLQMVFEANVVKFSKIALKSFNEKNKLTIDSTFAVALGAMASRRTFANTNPVYIELISSGNIELLKNENFKDKLINYYQELERIEKVIDRNNSLYTDQEFTPTMMQYGVLDTSEDFISITKSFTNLIETKPPLSAANIKHLLTISQKTLSTEENELFVINHLAARQDYAQLHVFFLTEFREKTEKLLEQTKAYFND